VVTVEARPIDPLPVALSGLVVIGSVTGRNSYLSEDKTGIYTEYSIHCDKVLFKRTSLAAPGDIVLTIRGGAVELPTGRVLREYVLGTPWLRLLPTQRYVLFLRYRASIDAFDIFKVWQIVDGKTQAMHPEDKLVGLNGVPLTEFIDSVARECDRQRNLQR
jgi:hypothetical protein